MSPGLYGRNMLAMRENDLQRIHVPEMKFLGHVDTVRSLDKQRDEY